MKNKMQSENFNEKLYLKYLKRNPKKAFEYCQNYVQQNPDDSNAIGFLGFHYEGGYGVEKNENKAFECYQKAVDLGNKEFLVPLSHCFLEGVGTEKDIEKADTILRNLKKTETIIKRSLKKKTILKNFFEEYKYNKSLSGKIGSFFYSLGKYYDYIGSGKKTFMCFKNASNIEKSNEIYWITLHIKYLDGYGNDKEAFECLLEGKNFYSEEFGYWGYLGLCYLNGIGTEIDKEKAKEMFQKALELKPDSISTKKLLEECNEIC